MYEKFTIILLTQGRYSSTYHNIPCMDAIGVIEFVVFFRMFCSVTVVSGPCEFAVTIGSIQFNCGISQPIILCSRPVGQDLFTILGNTCMYSLLVDVRFDSGWKMVHVPTHVATNTMVESAKHHQTNKSARICYTKKHVVGKVVLVDRTHLSSNPESQSNDQNLQAFQPGFKKTRHVFQMNPLVKSKMEKKHLTLEQFAMFSFNHQASQRFSSDPPEKK